MSLKNCVFVSLTRKTAGKGERQKAVKESIATAAAKLAFISEGKKCSSKMWNEAREYLRQSDGLEKVREYKEKKQ